MVNLEDIDLDKVDIENRIIYLNDDIESESLEEGILAIQYINKYDNEQEAKLKNYVREPITVIVDSYGGSVYDGMGLVNMITSSKTPVHTYCYSKGMSMGFMIFISGHKRYVHEHATLMYHQLSTWAVGTNKMIQDEAVVSEELNNRLMEIIVKRTGITKKKMKKKNKEQKDWYISGRKAIDLGVADELIEDTI